MSPAPGVQALLGLYRSLLSAYGPQGWWPLRSRALRPGFDEGGYHPGRYAAPRRAAERFEIAVGAVLTQNTTWRNVERGIDSLLAGGLLDPEAVLACPREKLAEHVRSCGYHNQKARKLVVLAAWFRESDRRRRSGGSMRERLLALWGVGPETADSILLYAYGLPTCVVDAYTVRLLRRLGWLRGGESYADVQGLLLRAHRAEGEDTVLYNELHALIVRHAKEHCRARPVCGGCPLALRCPWPG